MGNKIILKSVAGRSAAAWMYSSQYHAELKGADLLNKFMGLCSSSSGRMMLTAHAQDEIRHAALFKMATDYVGLEADSVEFANGYAELVDSQDTLAGKIFCFHILTETVSAASCTWRIRHIDDEFLNQIDNTVYKDEIRHLQMGESLLSICPEEDIKEIFRADRLKCIVKTFRIICSTSLPQVATDSIEIAASLQRHLDRAIIRAIANCRAATRQGVRNVEDL
jgi:hypothetical protein